MKLFNKQSGKFILASCFCGVITFFVVVSVLFVMACVNWFAEWFILGAIVLCWSFGGLTALLISRDMNQISLKAYLSAVLYFAIGTVYFMADGDASINGWLIFFLIGYAIVSIPAFLLLMQVTSKYI